MDQSRDSSLKAAINWGMDGVKASQVAVVIEHCSSRAKTFEIEVKDLFYIVKPKKLQWLPAFLSGGGNSDTMEKCILKGVSFQANPGELLAIAGPSGSGKSSLLDVLAGRIKPSSPKGSILINQQPMKVPVFRRVSGYVPQDDALFPLLSVEETLMYSACLRLPSSVSTKEKEERVKRVMEELGLMHVADTRIGSSSLSSACSFGKRGISGGERRRVSIGVDVIHDPAVLLLDEPTSGLDSAAAFQVVAMLHGMAKQRSRTIILSIHQPSYRILQLLSSMVLLAKGQVLHHGSLHLLRIKLESAGHKVPPNMNALEYAMEALATTTDVTSLLRPIPEHQAALQEEEREEEDEREKEAEKEREVGKTSQVEEEEEEEDIKVAFANSRIREAAILSHRFTRNIFRTHELFASRTVQSLGAAIVLGTLYIHVGFDERGIQERFGFFAFTLTFLLSSTIEALPIFLQERQVLIRESSRGAYRISSYVLSHSIVFLPFLLIVAILYAAPVYWLVGLSPSISSFLFFVLIVWLVIVAANALVAFLSALASNFIVGNTAIMAAIGAFFLFSGYFISKKYIPAYWMFMHYLSLFKYPLDAFLINEYSSLAHKCFSLDIIPGAVCSFTGGDILEHLDLDRQNKWIDVGVMVVFILGYRLLCLLVLYYKVQRTRK